ncbi:MAG TPA: hypothetical protein VFI10_02335 [Gaiellaceae bacterium]|nr:hypothetical protein [Gaiellaceae bacterium]
MPEPTPRDEVLTGRDDAATPIRALSRVALLVFAVFVVICAAAYGLWTALN